jgi:hypothetical protein
MTTLRRHKGMRRLLPLVLALFLLATACGDDGDAVEASGTADPDTPVTSPPVSDTAPTGTEDIQWLRIEPTDDLVDPVVATPDQLVRDPEDPDAVLVRFYGGVQECNGARATAEETDTEVRITLEVGGRPDAGDQACIEIAEAQELVVTLDAPVGTRELIAETGDRG